MAARNLHDQPMSSGSTIIINMEHISGRFKDLDELGNSDVTFIIEGQRIHAHRQFLAERSQYFDALLFGGLKESMEREVKLNVSFPAFADLLTYIYTGQVSLADKPVNAVMDILELAHSYGLLELENLIQNHFRKILSIENAISIYDAALFHRLEFLMDFCLKFMDQRSASIIEHASVLQSSWATVNQLLSRPSFYMSETGIFYVLKNWLRANPDADINRVLNKVNLNDISVESLLNIVRPTKLIPRKAISDAIAARPNGINLNSECLGRLLMDKNVADPKDGATVLQGGSPNFCILTGDIKNHDINIKYAQHIITDSPASGIIIKLGRPYIINYVEMSLWAVRNVSYSYYLEVSLDQEEWIRVIDHREYCCNDWQSLYFQPAGALYIRIVGTKCSWGNVFRVHNFKAYYTNDIHKIKNGFVVASNHTYVHHDYSNIDKKSGRSSISIRLGQPYYIGSMKLFLQGKNGKPFSYYIKVSSNSGDCMRVAEKSQEKSDWQTIEFRPPRLVTFVKIVDIHNTATNEFQHTHFKCPAEVGDDTESS